MLVIERTPTFQLKRDVNEIEDPYEQNTQTFHKYEDTKSFIEQIKGSNQTTYL